LPPFISVYAELALHNFIRGIRNGNVWLGQNGTVGAYEPVSEMRQGGASTRRHGGRESYFIHCLVVFALQDGIYNGHPNGAFALARAWREP